MSPLGLVVEALKVGTLNEIYFAGWVETVDVGESGPLVGKRCYRFRPQRHAIYLDLDGQLVECASLDSTAGPMLKLQVVREIDMGFPKDPDDEYAYAGELWNVLDSGRDFACVHKLDVFADDVCDVERGVARAFGLELDAGEYLFFDPFTWEGIHLGRWAARDAWLEATSARYSLRAYSCR